MRTAISLFLLLVFSGLGPVVVSRTGSLHGLPLSGSAFWIAEDDEDEEEPPPRSRQNMILRAFFRQRYLGLRTERYDLNETFMERYVDRQIDAFLDDVDSRLGKLNKALAEAVEAHAILLNPEDSSAEEEARKRFRKALKGVDDSAGGLKGKLLHVFLRIDSKEKLPLEIDSRGDYQTEMKFLAEQVKEAEERIRDYLFRTTNTVPYQNLKGENMMIRLYWAEKTADAIRDSLNR